MTKLTDRWQPLRPIEQQLKAFTGKHRFNTFPCGRRSGKTEIIGKRRVVMRALRGSMFNTPRFFCAAPTRDQAKRIFWQDLKALVHPNWRNGEPSEGELVIRLKNGAEIHVLGMDKPERIEGVGWDGGVLDEYANMKPNVWEAHIRPALSDRRGWCDFVGVPEGRNHYYDLHTYAKSQMMEKGDSSEWGAYHWISSLILPEEEIKAARQMMDELTFQQEYEASFVNFQGQAYYAYSEENQTKEIYYNPNEDLNFCFDFNVSPGVAVITQESILFNDQHGTSVIGEVYIPRNSNTPLVCSKLISEWAEHKGSIYLYGDATGGAKGTAQVRGSDWDIIEEELGSFFGDKIINRVSRSNPRERQRVNAVNARLKTADNINLLALNPAITPNLHKDFEGVRVLEGGAGEIDKKQDPKLTHLTDALGYYIAQEFPIDIENRISSFEMDFV